MLEQYMIKEESSLIQKLSMLQHMIAKLLILNLICFEQFSNDSHNFYTHLPQSAKPHITLQTFATLLHNFIKLFRQLFTYIDNFTQLCKYIQNPTTLLWLYSISTKPYIKQKKQHLLYSG